MKAAMTAEIEGKQLVLGLRAEVRAVRLRWVQVSAGRFVAVWVKGGVR